VEQFVAPSIEQMAADVVAFGFRHGLLWYRIPAAVASLLLLLASFLGPGRKHGEAAPDLQRSDLLYLLALAFFLFALRWPVLGLGDLEGDESVAVSAALTRYLDPAHGVTLFTGSAGPLLTYPVAALGLFGLRIDYGAAKLVSLLLVIAAPSFLYLALRTFSEARIARVALLPLLAFVGMGNMSWMLPYCSEQWINLLAASMIYFLMRLGRQIGREGVNLSGIGLALGLMPLVKWQGMPMAALGVACAISIVGRRCLQARVGLGGLAVRLLPLVALGLAPLLFWCAILWMHGSLEYFFQTYVVALFGQATSRFPSTFAERLMALPAWGVAPFPMLQLFLSVTALFWVPAVIHLCLVGRPRRFPLDLAWAALYLVVSAYAVLQPGGGFWHYLNLLLQPYALLFMLTFCHLAKAAARPGFELLAYLGLTVLIPAIGYLQGVPLPVSFQRATIRSTSVDALRELDLAGSPMIQWGWVYPYYIYSGTTWGTRTGGSHEILEPFFPNKSLFVADYVESLESGRAPVFLDTATEGSPVYGIRAVYGHEQVPEVAEAVRRNYFLCAELSATRLYLQRERYRARAEIPAWCASRPR
jgi:hypothetical protein